MEKKTDKKAKTVKEMIDAHYVWCHICRGGRWCDDMRYLQQCLKDSENPHTSKKT